MEEMETDPALGSSDSNDSSSDDEEEKTFINRAEELERQLSDNKYLYDVHAELVNLYRKLGDLKSMRAAYERFHEYFPLTPQIWLDWINDEKKLASSEDDIKSVFSLFEKAVEDYLSVALWQEYAQYSIGTSDLKTTRAILERGLTAAGLHAAEGSLLWDTLREVELAHLSLTETGSDQWKEGTSRVAEIFRRQLSVPLTGMENTYAEWEEWYKILPEGHGVDSKPIEWGYQKALKTLETYKPFENKLLVTKDDAQLYQTYKDYIKVLTDPSTILCVYERAVAQLCLIPNVWTDYCLYAFKFGDTADKISRRALRNCPWSEELWITRLRSIEHLQKGDSEALSCFEQGMTNMIAPQGLELWLAYLEYTNRTSDDKEKLYKLFEQAVEQLGNNCDKVTRWYARIRAKNGDMVTARRLWKNILKGSQNKTAASVWLEYANLERQYGEPSQLRGVFQRGLASCKDWPQFLAEEWLMFERESGTLQDVLKCSEKCKEVLYKAQAQAQSQKAAEDAADVKGKKRKHQNDQNVATGAKKFKNEETKPLLKKIPVVKDPTKTVFISNLYPSINEIRLQKVFPNAVNIELVVDRQGKSRCYGYVQFEMEEEVMTALARDRELLDGRPIFISNCKPDRNERKAAFKYSSNVEGNKLFIRGLPVDKTKEDVEAIFEPYGVKEVRLVLQKSGQPKGLAYAEFENEEAAKKALKATDQMKIGDHLITVAISAPPTKSSKIGKAQEPVRHARSKLQLPMIPRALQVKGDKKDASNGSGDGPSGEKRTKTNEDFRKMLLNK